MRPIAPSKTETARFEPFAYLSSKSIFVPRTDQDCKAAAEEILASGLTGFDTESKPIFTFGEVSDGPHVVQFALSDKAFVFQLHRRNCRSFIVEILQSEKVLKVGFGLKSDRGQILSKFGVKPREMLDLDTVFRKKGYTRQMGVRAAVGAVLHQHFSKSKKTTTSNWAASELSERQLLYAANDAFAALKVMEALKLRESPSLLLAS
jgi:ribonuclease D